MTEAEWSGTADAVALLNHLFGARSPDSTTSDPRQLRRYFLSCGCRAWDRLPWVCRELMSVAEALADRVPVDPRLESAAKSAAEELTHSRAAASALVEAEAYLAMAGRTRPPDVELGDAGFTEQTWPGVAHLVYYAFDPTAPILTHVPRDLHDADAVRDVFGVPFRATWFDRRWRTGAVRDLARSMHKSTDYAAMPVLADALEEAGCGNADVLAHCRGGGPHVRGCWVLEGLLSDRH